MGILSLILNFLGGGVVQSLADAFKAREQAQTDQARVAADERIQHLQSIRDVQVAEAGSRINAFVRAGFAVPVVLYLGKLILWDKILGWGATDDLSANLWTYVNVVVGFYFISDASVRVAQIIKRK